MVGPVDVTHAAVLMATQQHMQTDSKILQILQ